MLAIVTVGLTACGELKGHRDSESSARTALPTRVSPAISDGATRRVWSPPSHIEPLAAPSADGRRLPFIDWQTGDLAVFELATGETRRLTGSPWLHQLHDYAETSAISPDGSRIAYTWWCNDCDRYELRVIEVDDPQDMRVLVSNDQIKWMRPYHWSWTGQQIAALFMRPDGSFQIAVVSVADGSFRVLKSLGWREPQGMFFSADGRFIAYDLAEDDSPERDVYVLATDGSRETVVVDHEADDFLLGWAPDGAAVLFGSHRGGTPSAWVVSVSDGKRVGHPRLVRSDMWRVLPLGFSRSGSYYYAVEADRLEVYVAMLDAGEGMVTSEPTAVGERYHVARSTPSWSPDGQKLAFITQRGPFWSLRSRGVVIRSAVTGESREVVPDLTYFNSLQWDRDGLSIFVRGQDAKGRGGIYRIDTQTGEATAVLLAEPESNMYGHAVSNDGRMLYYHVRGSVTGILTYEIARGRSAPLYTAATPRTADSLWVAYAFHPSMALSPNGKWLALIPYWRKAAVLLPVAGGTPRTVLSAPEGMKVIGVTWTPSGDYLLVTLFDGTGDGRREIWRVGQDGSDPRQIEFPNAASGAQGTYPDAWSALSVHPDGRQIAFTAGESRLEVWVMEDFLPETPASPGPTQ